MSPEVVGLSSPRSDTSSVRHCAGGECGGAVGISKGWGGCSPQASALPHGSLGHPGVDIFQCPKGTAHTAPSTWPRPRFPSTTGGQAGQLRVVSRRGTPSLPSHPPQEKQELTPHSPPLAAPSQQC